jgi:hypothetical protein
MTNRESLKYRIVTALAEGGYREEEAWKVAQEIQNKTQSSYHPTSTGWQRLRIKKKEIQ